jgi:hypothetical protein
MLPATQTQQAPGILLVQQESRGGKTETIRTQIEKTRVRAETHASGDSRVMLFDSKADVMRMLFIDKKTYIEKSRAELDQLVQSAFAGPFGAAGGPAPQVPPEVVKQLQQQFQNAPPDQQAAMRPMIEQLLRDGTPGPPPPPDLRLNYRRIGADKVGQWPCTKYEGFNGSQKVKEVCVADPQTLGLTAADFEVMTRLIDFVKGLQAEDLVMFGTTEGIGYSGIPVRQTRFANGTAVSSTEIQELRRETFPATIFDVPAGFTKQGPIR